MGVRRGCTVAAVDLRHEPVTLETDRYRIEGLLTLPREGYRSRLSDFVNQRDREFFSISNAKISTLDTPPDQTMEVPFIMVARHHVHLVTPQAPDAVSEQAPPPVQASAAEQAPLEAQAETPEPAPAEAPAEGNGTQ